MPLSSAANAVTGKLTIRSRETDETVSFMP